MKAATLLSPLYHDCPLAVHPQGLAENLGASLSSGLPARDAFRVCRGLLYDLGLFATYKPFSAFTKDSGQASCETGQLQSSSSKGCHTPGLSTGSERIKEILIEPVCPLGPSRPALLAQGREARKMVCISKIAQRDRISAGQRRKWPSLQLPCPAGSSTARGWGDKASIGKAHVYQ